MRQLRRELLLPAVTEPIFAGRHSPRLVLALFSHLIGKPQPDWPAQTLVTGFPFYEEPNSSLSPQLLQFLDGGEPPIVFTLGSTIVWDAGNFFDNGARVERLGAGRVLPRKHYRADRVAGELRQMLENPSYQTTATVIGQQMQQEDGVGAACDAIEKQLLPQTARTGQAG